MTNAELIVLGLLAEGYTYGYQIEAKVKERNIRHWADIGYSSIYYILGKLEKKHLVTSKHEESAQGPNRRVFTMTAAGKRLLTDQVLVKLSQRIPVPSSFYIGLALLNNVDQKAAGKALAEHAVSVHTRLRQLEQDYQRGQPVAMGVAFDFGRRLAEFELSWLEGLITRLH